jgi:PAS domain S-box-containing protein
VLMSCQLPMSDNSPECCDSFDPLHPFQEAGISDPPEDRPGRSRATYWIDPLKIRRTTSRWAYAFPCGGTQKRTATDMKETDRDLLQARDNFAAIFHASPAILCIIQLNGLRYCEINEAYEECTGYRRDEVLGKGSLKLGLWSNVEDRDRMFLKLLAQGRLRGHQEVFLTKTGGPITTLLSAEIIQFDGSPCALVVAEDITMRQRAEEARLDLAQRLINAQEAECTRVGRELHDSIGQSLALFTMELERTRLALTDLSPDSDARWTHLCSRLKALNRDVANLSHQLHSSELELLGLAVAVKALCREFSEHYHVQAHCKCSGVLGNVTADVSLCLFRVMQEALHNIAKHSQATKIDVELNGTSNSFHLTISDDGVGFAQNATNARPGLGLISMRERLHLIGGKFIITAKPGAGTCVEAIVPMTKATTP